MTEITTTSAAEVAAETAEFSAANGTVGSDFERMIEEIRSHDRFLLTAHEGPDGDALGPLPRPDPHLGAGRDRHQPARIEHASGLDFAVGELAHRLHQGRGRSRRVSGIDDIHESHAKTPF